MSPPRSSSSSSSLNLQQKYLELLPKLSTKKPSMTLFWKVQEGTTVFAVGYYCQPEDQTEAVTVVVTKRYDSFPLKRSPVR